MCMFVIQLIVILSWVSYIPNLGIGGGRYYLWLSANEFRNEIDKYAPKGIGLQATEAQFVCADIVIHSVSLIFSGSTKIVHFYMIWVQIIFDLDEVRECAE